MATFVPEKRYVVFKLTDIEKYLSEQDKIALTMLGTKLATRRALSGREPFDALVVERDWPEYDLAWDALTARIEREASPPKPPQ